MRKRSSNKIKLSRSWSFVHMQHFVIYFFSNFNSCEAIAAIGDIVFFFNWPSPSTILATIVFFNFNDFYCFAAKICGRDVICSAFRLIV